jgi:hypothetical protein
VKPQHSWSKSNFFFQHAISIYNKSQLSLNQSSFDNWAWSSIYIDDNSVGEVFTVKISNSNYSGVLIGNGSKLNIHDTIIQNCRDGISCFGKSEVNASDCKFNKIQLYPLSCYSSANIILEGCEFNDPKEAFFYLDGGIIKISTSKLCQSNKAIPISEIIGGGKITLMKVRIEWNGLFDRLSSFANADFVQLKDVVLNGNRISDYLLEKQ